MAEDPNRCSGDDRLLVSAARDGHQRAWDALVHRYSGEIWAWAGRYKLSRSDVWDVSLLTWLRLADRLDVIDPDSVGLWLGGTVERESTRLARLAPR